jgi:hypothetical protein
MLGKEKEGLRKSSYKSSRKGVMISRRWNVTSRLGGEAEMGIAVHDQLTRIGHRLLGVLELINN